MFDNYSKINLGRVRDFIQYYTRQEATGTAERTAKKIIIIGLTLVKLLNRMIIDGEITENNIKDVLEHDYNFNTNDEVLQAKILNPKELGSKAFLFFSSKFDYREIINITPECFNIVNIAVSSYIADILQYIGRHIKELKHYISPNQFIRGYREYHEKLDPKNEKIQSLFHMTLKLMDIEQNKEIYQIIEYKIQSETQDTSKIGEEVYNDLKKEEEISKDTITMNLEIAQRSERNDLTKQTLEHIQKKIQEMNQNLSGQMKIISDHNIELKNLIIELKNQNIKLQYKVEILKFSDNLEILGRIFDNILSSDKLDENKALLIEACKDILEDWRQFEPTKWEKISDYLIQVIEDNPYGKIIVATGKIFNEFIKWIRQKKGNK